MLTDPSGQFAISGPSDVTSTTGTFKITPAVTTPPASYTLAPVCTAPAGYNGVTYSPSQAVTFTLTPPPSDVRLGAAQSAGFGGLYTLAVSNVAASGSASGVSITADAGATLFSLAPTCAITSMGPGESINCGLPTPNDVQCSGGTCTIASLEAGGRRALLVQLSGSTPTTVNVLPPGTECSSFTVPSSSATCP